MARIRTIKPQFFTSKKLGRCSFPARLLASALLTLADREGRLEWLPMVVHGSAFPYDKGLDIEALADELVRAGFLERYSVDDRDFAWVVNFRKHQNITGKERYSKSRLPKAPGDTGEDTVAENSPETESEFPGKATERPQENSKPAGGVPGNERGHGNRAPPHRAQALGNSQPTAEDLQNPRKTEVLAGGEFPGNARTVPGEFTERGNRKEEIGKGKEERERGPDADASPPPPEMFDIVDTWNLSLGQSCKLTPKRRDALRARLRDAAFRDHWREAITRAAASDFCRGVNDRGWRADLEWFLRPDSVVKLLEGKYDNRGKQKWGNGPGQTYDPNAPFGEDF